MTTWVGAAGQPVLLTELELPAAKKRRTDENVTTTPPTQAPRFSIASLIHHHPLPQAPAPVAKLAPLVPVVPVAPAVRPCTPEQQLSTPTNSIVLEHGNKDLSATMVESRNRMLSAAEIRDLLLSRLNFPERPNCSTPDWAIYKECPKQRRRAKKSDRWANSGGMRGSRDLPYNSATPYVRRRYGSVFPHGGGKLKGKRYYEYTLLRTNPDGSIVEDKTCTLFHILPGPGETDRGRRFAPPEDKSSHTHTISFQAPQSPPLPSGTISPPIVLSMPQMPQARRINKPLPSQVVPLEKDNQAALARRAAQTAVNIKGAAARKQLKALKDAQTRQEALARKEALARQDLLAHKEMVARQDLLRSQEQTEQMSMLTAVSALSDLLGGMGD